MPIPIVTQGFYFHSHHYNFAMASPYLEKLYCERPYEIFPSVSELYDFVITMKYQFLIRFGVLVLEKKKSQCVIR